MSAQVLFVIFKRQHLNGGNVPAHLFPDGPAETMRRAERRKINQRHHFSIDGIKGGDCLHESIYHIPEYKQVNFWFFAPKYLFVFNLTAANYSVYCTWTLHSIR